MFDEEKEMIDKVGWGLVSYLMLSDPWTVFSGHHKAIEDWKLSSLLRLIQNN